MSKRSSMFLCAILILGVAFVGIYAVSAENKAAPQPDVVPAEIGASPYSQTVLSPSYEGVWDVGVEGEGCIFRRKVASESGRWRPRFRSMSTTQSGGCRPHFSF